MVLWTVLWCTHIHILDAKSNKNIEILIVSTCYTQPQIRYQRLCEYSLNMHKVQNSYELTKLVLNVMVSSLGMTMKTFTFHFLYDTSISTRYDYSPLIECLFMYNVTNVSASIFISTFTHNPLCSITKQQKDQKP